MNLLVGFRAVIEPPAGENVVLRVAAATIYRAWINGQFLGCGPARGPHGYFRVDQWDLSHKVQPGKNVIALEVAGYNANSYYLLDQPSFLQAEVVADDRVLVSTGGVGEQFSSRMLDYRVQKVQRYSFQRPFTEVYRLTPDFDRWRRETADSAAAVTVAVLPEKTFCHVGCGIRNSLSSGRSGSLPRAESNRSKSPRIPGKTARWPTSAQS